MGHRFLGEEKMLQVLQEKLSEYTYAFWVYNQNAFYYLLYFMKNYWMYMIVVAAIFYMFYSEAQEIANEFVEDERRII